MERRAIREERAGPARGARGRERARGEALARLGPALALALVVGVALGGCAAREVPPDPAYRGPKPLPERLAAPLAYAAVPLAPALVERAPRPAARWWEGHATSTCVATGAPIEVAFELFLTTAAEGPRPLVVVVPILGGGYGIERIIADAAAEAGWHALLVHRERDLLDGDNDPADVERLIRRALVNIRRALDWALARPDVDRERVGLVGVSLGAILGSVLAAVEPRIGPKVLVMAGGDVPTIVRDSVEQPVHRYKIDRMDRLGLAEDAALEESLRAGFALDPLDYAPYVDARDVLQLITLYDNRVPTRNQWLLWEALGRPRAYAIPSGHYTLALHRERALAAMRAFFGERFGGVGGVGGGGGVSASAPRPSG